MGSWYTIFVMLRYIHSIPNLPWLLSWNNVEIFVKDFCCICLGDHAIYISDVMNYMYWLTYVGSSSISGMKPTWSEWILFFCDLEFWFETFTPLSCFILFLVSSFSLSGSKIVSRNRPMLCVTLFTFKVQKKSLWSVWQKWNGGKNACFSKKRGKKKDLKAEESTKTSPPMVSCTL